MKASTEDRTRSFQHLASVHASAFPSYQLSIIFYSHFVCSEKYIGHSEKYKEIKKKYLLSYICQSSTRIYTCSNNIYIRDEPKIPGLKCKDLSEWKSGVCHLLDEWPWISDLMLWNLDFSQWQNKMTCSNYVIGGWYYKRIPKYSVCMCVYTY